MDRLSNFETSLPEDYVLIKHIDAKNNGKLIAIYTILSFVPLIIILPALCFIAYYCNKYSITDTWYADYGPVALLVTCGVLILYIVLHELVHGITYKFFTGAKLTFGLTLTVAFCGVPNIYVRKKASAFALMMPFLIFSVIFIALTICLWLISPLYGILSGAVFAIHLGGCVGDLHWISMYITKYRHCNTLMRDTGPEQWLYIPKSESEKYSIAPIPFTQSQNAENFSS